MITCSVCGVDAPDQAVQCSSCGTKFPGSVPADATVPLETVAIGAAGAAPAVSKAVRGSSFLSRLSSSSDIPDEGRFLPGTLIAGRYRIIGLLGRGGMGEVYRATDLALAQSVALKFLPEDAANNERLLERFHNEVRIARQVSHPNVCRVYDIGEADGMPFISMEYVDGEDLGSLLQRIGRLPGDKALQTARKICAGVAAAHERGIIHRDLKPQNVMLNRRGEVVVMDFGLAAVADELRGTEARNGTPAYMSPEQLRGDSVTAKSDIYALGLIIYELFTGKRAFEADSMQELVRMQESTRPVSVTSLASDADPAVERVILRCLQHDASQRPSTALAVAAALPGGDPLAAALAAGETPSPEMVAASGKTERFPLKYAVPCLVFVLLAVLAVPFAVQKTAMLAVAPPELSPPVLEQKARELAAAFGYPEKPLDSRGWLREAGGLMAHFEKLPGRKDWKVILSALPPHELVYRQSPANLTAPPDGNIDEDRPALNLPGMVTAVVSSSGALRGFAAVPPAEANASGTPGSLDAAAVFKSAKLDIAQFREIPPVYVPPLAFDERRAWTGSYPGVKDLPVTVEIASFRGKLTSFFIRWPWTKLPGVGQTTRTISERVLGVFSLLFLGTGLFCVVFFARRNLKKGRGDRRGAWRIASLYVVLMLVRWFAVKHFIPSGEMLGYAFEDFSVYFAVGTLFWLLYVGLEPAVRARWPHSLVTWNRVLAGQFSDARVGEHILIGATIGVLIQVLFAWRTYWDRVNGAPPDMPSLNLLMGPGHFIGDTAILITGAIQSGAIIFFLLCGLRAIVRRDWAATVLAGLLLAVNQSGVRESMNQWLDFPLYVGIFAAFAYTLLRAGMVPAIVGIVVVNILGRVPIGSDPAAWYTPAAALLLATVASIAVYGFWRSQAPPGAGANP